MCMSLAHYHLEQFNCRTGIIKGKIFNAPIQRVVKMHSDRISYTFIIGKRFEVWEGYKQFKLHKMGLI